MIYKNIDNPKKRERLVEMINMKQIDNDIRILIREFYGDEIDEKVDEKEAEIKERIEREVKEKQKLVKTEIIREMENFDEENGTYKELFENIVSCLALL